MGSVLISLQYAHDCNAVHDKSKSNVLGQGQYRSSAPGVAEVVVMGTSGTVVELFYIVCQRSSFLRCSNDRLVGFCLNGALSDCEKILVESEHLTTSSECYTCHPALHLAA